MFLISIAMGRSQPIVWTLMFRTEEKAVETFKLLHENMGGIAVADDFGQTIFAERANILSMLLENVEQSKLAHVERGLHEQRIRAAIVTRMAADPTLRRGAGGGSGPAMLTPIPGGGFPG
jgi:hypothetical protein